MWQRGGVARRFGGGRQTKHLLWFACAVACGYRRFSMLVLCLVSFMGKSPQKPVLLQLDCFYSESLSTCQSTLCFTFSPLIVSLDCFDSEFIYAPLTKLHLLLPL
jgi:hypothetical protein